MSNGGANILLYYFDILPEAWVAEDNYFEHALIIFSRLFGVYSADLIRGYALG